MASPSLFHSLTILLVNKFLMLTDECSKKSENSLGEATQGWIEHWMNESATICNHPKLNYSHSAILSNHIVSIKKCENRFDKRERGKGNSFST